jgi:hypothetical protein
MRKPPASTAMTAATLYMVYMVPMAARLVWNAWIRVVSMAPTLS